jgi:hypothetical protein
MVNKPKRWVFMPMCAKEVGCQARKHFLQVRELLGIVFPRCQDIDKIL